MITVGILVTNVPKISKFSASCYAFANEQPNMLAFYFRLRDIDIVNKKVAGWVKDTKTNVLTQQMFDYPDVVESHYPRSRKSVGFSNYLEMVREKNVKRTVNGSPFLNKAKVNKLVSMYNDGQYAIDTVAYSASNLQVFLDKYKSVIVKPNGSLQGKNVFLIENNEGGIRVTANGDSIVYSPDKFDELCEKTFRATYIIGTYINTVDAGGAAYSIRANYSIDEDGRWIFRNSATYVNMKPGNIISNDQDNGRVIIMGHQDFLAVYFGKDYVKFFDKELENIGKNVLPIVDSGTGQESVQMGLDILIESSTGEIKIVEINQRPAMKTLFYEMAKARPVAYRHLAKMDGKQKLL